MMGLLMFFGSIAGMWLWTVKERGEWNLIFANIAGAFSGLMVGSLLLMLYSRVFDPALINPNAGRSLFGFLTVVGVGYGTWKLIALGDHTPNNQLARHIIGGFAGLFAALLVAIFITSYFFVKTQA